MFFGGKYSAKTLQKWRKKRPAAAKLLQLWANMNEDERAETALAATEDKWAEAWLAELPNEQSEQAFLALWSYVAAEQENLLGVLVQQMGEKQKARTAAALLQKLADDRVISPLIVQLLREEKYDLAQGAEVLGCFQEKSGRVLALVYTDMNAAEKTRILQLLSLLKPETSCSILSAAMQEPDEKLRVLAAKTTADIAPGSLSGEELLEFLQPLMADSSSDVRMTVCETLGRCGGTAALPALNWYFRHDNAWTVKSMCSSFLTKWEAQIAEQILRDEGEMYAEADADGDADAEKGA
jgi:hypothetical protein